jgi:hypothetical protein
MRQKLFGLSLSQWLPSASRRCGAFIDRGLLVDQRVRKRRQAFDRGAIVDPEDQPSCSLHSPLTHSPLKRAQLVVWKQFGCSPWVASRA